MDQGAFDNVGSFLVPYSTVRRQTSTPGTRSDNKKAQIRAAAKELFLQRGFQATSTDAIAAAASSSKETLYRYYPKKEDLLVDVLRSLTVERSFWLKAMDNATEPTSKRQLRTRLRTTIVGLLETMMQPDYLAMLRLIVAESPRFPELGDLFRQTILAQGTRYFATLLHAGQRHGVVRHQVDPSTVARMCLGSLLTYVLPNGLIHGTEEPQIPDVHAIDALVDHLIALVAVRSQG